MQHLVNQFVFYREITFRFWMEIEIEIEIFLKFEHINLTVKI